MNRAPTSPDDLREVDDLDVQLQPPGGDAGHVEQLVDESVQAGCLRVDLFDLRDEARGRVVRGLPPRDPGQVRDLQLEGGQRRAQFVRRHREEIIPQDDRLAQSIFGAFLIVDVRRGRDPPDDGPVDFRLRNRPCDVPAVTAVGGAPDPHLALERNSAAEAGFPRGAGLGAILRVQAIPERLLPHRFGLEAAIGQPGPVPEGDLAVGVRRPDALGQGVEQMAVALLALALERLAFPFVQQAFLQLQLLAPDVKLDEHRRLRAQDVGVEGLHQVVDGAVRVARGTRGLRRG